MAYQKDFKMNLNNWNNTTEKCKECGSEKVKRKKWLTNFKSKDGNSNNRFVWKNKCFRCNYFWTEELERRKYE